MAYEILCSALKHGFTEEEILGVLGMPSQEIVMRHDPLKVLHIGFSSAGVPLEVITDASAHDGARREEAEAFRALAKDVESELAGDLDRYDPELIDGVRLRWISQGVAARDETAFRHALKVGHRLRARGERLTDAAIIDAYEHAYEVAQIHGGAGRVREMPAMRDRLTMARRVRGYVTQSSRKSPSYGVSGGAGRVTSAQRKALATMGRRGGLKAAQRWKDRDSNYAQAQLKKLHQANERRHSAGGGRAVRVSMHSSLNSSLRGECNQLDPRS